MYNKSKWAVPRSFDERDLKGLIQKKVFMFFRLDWKEIQHLESTDTNVCKNPATYSTTDHTTTASLSLMGTERSTIQIISGLHLKNWPVINMCSNRWDVIFNYAPTKQICQAGRAYKGNRQWIGQGEQTQIKPEAPSTNCRHASSPSYYFWNNVSSFVYIMFWFCHDSNDI